MSAGLGGGAVRSVLRAVQDRQRQAGRHRANRPRRGRRWLSVGARVLVSLLSLSVLVFSGYVWATYRSFTANVTHIDAIVKPRPGRPGQPAPHDIDGADQNILLVGDDHRPPGASPALLKLLNTQPDGGGVNTDTMMVLHIPADGAKATVISFPRDSWVDIPGFGQNKLNAAFAFGSQNGGGDTGGARLLIQVIQNLTGLHIDHFVRVSMVGFYDIARILGPITVCLNQATQDSYSGTNLPAGVSTLNAQQALAFVRQRHNLPRGDLDREVRQQYFLAAAFRKLTSAGVLLNPLKLQNLLHAVSSSLETDPGLDLLSFAEQVQNLSAGNVTFATIPITGTPTITVDGNDVDIVAVDFAALPGFIAQVIGQPTAYTKAVPAPPSAVTVQVINATSTADAAASNSAALTRLGFHTTTPSSTPTPTTSTLIEYPVGMEAQAKAVAAHVPGALVSASTAVHQVTLVLGADGQHVHTFPDAPTPGTQPPPTTPPPARAYTPTDCIN